MAREFFSHPMRVPQSTSEGQPLPKQVRRGMEAAFGVRLADVRVHVGPEAAGVGALAYTDGSHIHFSPGSYEPHTRRGQEILGHELAHVVQQREGRVRNAFGAGAAVVHDPKLEADADRAGRRAASWTHSLPTYAPPARPEGAPARTGIVQRMWPATVATPALSSGVSTWSNATCPVGLYSSSGICATTPEARIQDLEQQVRLQLTFPISYENNLAIERLENEIRIAKRELEQQDEFRPDPKSPTYSNSGSWKDWWNARVTGLWRYHADPTKIAGVQVLGPDTDLLPGYYAYSYRVTDNKIAVYYTGSSSETNKVAHSYLASGGDVYAAGMLESEGGKKIKVIDSASGHYLPDPKRKLDEFTCDESTTTTVPLENVKRRLDDLGYDVSGATLRPFRHPALVQQTIDCQARRNRFF